MPEPLRPEYQTYTPAGLVDAIDGNTSRQGGMISLQNLIFDPETPGLFICRAAAYALSAFPGFNTPGYVSCYKVFGNIVAGLLSTARNPGNDEPFVLNLTTGAFATISGVTSSNTPASPATSGAWTPPTLDMVGSYIVFTHPGFNGAGNGYFGWLQQTGPNAYTWNSGNTGTNALPSVPTSVIQFYNRAYFACGNVEYYTDILAPLNITNSTNTLTVGGSDAIVATVGQPFFTTQTGGIIAAVLVFKNAQIWQITGDLSVQTVAGQPSITLNKLSDGVGTAAPRSLVNTPVGVMFVAADGIRTVGLSGQVSEANADLTVPFLNPITPSRIAAAYNVGYYRICTNFLKGGVLQTVEYWYSTKRNAWCGPHSLTYDNIVGALSTFLTTGAGYTGKILQSNVIPSKQTDFYTELGANLSWIYQTVLVPEFSAMQGWSLFECSAFMEFQLQQTITANVLDQAGLVIGTASVMTPFLAPNNATNWQINFATTANSVVGAGSSPVPIASRHAFQLTGISSANLGIGTIFAHYQYQPDVNALSFTSAAYSYSDLDFGLVTDSNLYYTLDWGSVADGVQASIDFEANGVHAGPP